MTQLTAQQQRFVDAQVALGAFRSSGEVVQAALELLDARQREYACLQDALAQVEHGNVAELDVQDIKTRGRERLDLL
ncbi:MAG TPA: type II toxin-antitoxin system ParD family antitoxin [Lacipirellulaceae bacterium]|nr:type II toxin-antitoxin system ParD family antitoxin [Lacipirellulaceae bacterium]